jgi:hypothetical protein
MTTACFCLPSVVRQLYQSARFWQNLHWRQTHLCNSTGLGAALAVQVAHSGARGHHHRRIALRGEVAPCQVRLQPSLLASSPEDSIAPCASQESHAPSQ